MKFIFREATEGDLPAILALYGQLGQDDGTVLSLDAALSLFSRLKSYPDYRIHVAVADNHIVGTFAMLVMDNMAHCGARSAILEDIVVEEEKRGQGIGKAMMAYAGTLCQEKKCYKMVLNSNQNRERAHRFYQALGYERHGYSFAIFPAAPTTGTEGRTERSLELMDKNNDQ